MIHFNRDEGEDIERHSTIRACSTHSLIEKEGVCGMAQRPQQTWQQWPGWSMISASNYLGFTLWFTGLHGTGKSTLAALLQNALTLRGYKVEIIDSNTLSYWLQHELHIDETIK